MIKERTGGCKYTVPVLFYYGRCPSPPSNVRVSPVMYLKSGEASCTHTRPISSSASPKCPAGGVCTFFSKASG